MSDPTTGSATDVTGGASGGQTGLNQALVGAIAAAVQTAVSQATAQMQVQLQSLTENLNKVQEATTSDVDSQTVSRSSIDPASPQRRQEGYAEMAVADAIEFRKGCDSIVLGLLARANDHFSALPPIAPRSSTGPGTSGA